jgi:hypothetical protein
MRSLMKLREWIEDSYWAWKNACYCRFDSYDFRLDDFAVTREFWSAINQGWELMEYKWVFEEFWGKGSYPPPTITLPAKDFDSLVERLELPSEKTMESIKRLMKRPLPWSEQ